MHIIIDLVMVAILAFCMWRGYKNGLIVGVCGVLALIAAIFVGNLVAEAYYTEFSGVLEPFATGIVDGAVSAVTDNDETEDVYVLEADKKTDTYWVSFTALRNLGLVEGAADPIAQEVHGEEERVGRNMCDVLTEKLSERLTFVAIFALFFALTFIVFAFIGNLISLKLELPGLKIVDIASGIALGACRGIVILLFLACLCRYLGLLLGDELIQSTSILEWLMNSNLIANKLGI